MTHHRANGNDLLAQAFARLGEERQLQEYSAIIFKLLGLVIDFISAEGETLRLSKGVNFNPFCTALRGTPEGRAACGRCDVENARRAAESRQPVCYSCYAGLHELLIPLFGDKGQYLGAMTSGQFHLDGRRLRSRREIAALARKYGLDADDLWTKYRNSISLTRTQAEGVIGYLGVIGRHLTSLREHLLFMERADRPDRIEAVRKYIEENCAQPLCVRELALRFHISPDYLAHEFTKAVHVPLHRFLVFCRVSRAKALLQETRLTAAEVATQSGFGSVSQFNRAFRHETGMTVTEFRARQEE